MSENDSARAAAQLAAVTANIAKGAAEPMEPRSGPSKASCHKSSRSLPVCCFFCCAFR